MKWPQTAMAAISMGAVATILHYGFPSTRMDRERSVIGIVAMTAVILACTLAPVRVWTAFAWTALLSLAMHYRDDMATSSAVRSKLLLLHGRLSPNYAN